MIQFIKKTFFHAFTIAVLFVSQNTNAQTYCTPPYTVGCSQGDYINSFGLASYTMPSGCSPGNYSLNTGPVCYYGRSYPFGISIGSSFLQHVGIWVDYNDDGTFADPSHTAEFVYSSPSSGSAFTGSFDPFHSSLSVAGGWTRMRVRTTYHTAGVWEEGEGINWTEASCQSRQYGETEDYEIFLSPFPGTLASGNQMICYGGNPNFIVFGATDLLGTGFQWYYKDGIVAAPNIYEPVGSWNPIIGATGSNYDPPAGLNITRTYVCRITSWGTPYGGAQTVWVEGARQVTVLPPFNAGMIAGGDEVFCNSGNPAPINLLVNPTGSGAYQWRWYWRENSTGACPSGSSTAGWATNSTSPNVTGTTNTGAGITFDPAGAGAVGAGRTFSVLITPLALGGAPACGTPQWVNSCRRTTVNNCTSFSPGVLASGNQTLCFNGDPANITFSMFPSPSATYQWYYQNGIIAAPANSAPTTGWTMVPNANSSAYDPPAPLATSRTYACRVIGGGTTQWATGVRQITILPAFNPGTIASGDQSLCSNGNPALISLSIAPSGSGSFTYQWYYKNAVVTCPTGNSITGWTPVSAGTAASYDPMSANTTGRTFTLLVTPSGTPTCGTSSFTNSCRRVTVIPPPCSSSRVAVDENSDSEETDDLNESPALFQNVPNPFSTETTISCFVPENALSGAIRVYGIDGRQVEEIIITGNGRKEVILPKGKLSPGMYLYSLVVDGQIMAVKKLSVTW